MVIWGHVVGQVYRLCDCNLARDICSRVGVVAPIPAHTPWFLLAVFVTDLGVKFQREPIKRTFLRRRWFDILMVIPVFRILRILKFVRLLRLLKTMRIAKAGRFPGIRMLEALRRKGTRLVRAVKG